MHTKEIGTLGTFAKCRKSGKCGGVTCAHVVHSCQYVCSEESGKKGYVDKTAFNESTDAAFVVFDKEDISFKFVDGSETSLPGLEITEVLGCNYKYYGNTSWFKGTGIVTGSVISKKAAVKIEGQQFCNVLKLSNIAKSGDSGALVVSEDGNQPIGLLFATNKENSYAIPIHNVQDALEIDLLNKDVT